MLVVLIVIDNHLDKIVLNLEKGTNIKRKDILPGCLIAVVIRYLDPGQGSAIMILLILP